VPPDMPVKQLVVSDDAAKAAGAAPANAAAPSSGRALTVSADTRAHAGVIR